MDGLARRTLLRSGVTGAAALGGGLGDGTRVDGGTLVVHTRHVGIDANPGTDATATLDWGFDERERSFTVQD